VEVQAVFDTVDFLLDVPSHEEVCVAPVSSLSDLELMAIQIGYLDSRTRGLARLLWTIAERMKIADRANPLADPELETLRYAVLTAIRSSDEPEAELRASGLTDARAALVASVIRQHIQADKER
jgi:hypothetical protein